MKKQRQRQEIHSKTTKIRKIQNKINTNTRRKNKNNKKDKQDKHKQKNKAKTRGKKERTCTSSSLGHTDERGEVYATPTL
jgi:hypothetical protein